MTEPLVVLVTGPPGAGKTTLALDLAPRLALPLITKDDIKESLFDSLGWSDNEWSTKLSIASYDLILLFAHRLVAGGVSFVLEANLHRDASLPRYLSLRERAPFRCVEIFCIADEETLRRRESERTRHPGHHVVHTDAPLLGRQDAQPLELNEHLIRVDTSDGRPVDLDEIVRLIEEVRDGSRDR